MSSPWDSKRSGSKGIADLLGPGPVRTGERRLGRSMCGGRWSPSLPRSRRQAPGDRGTPRSTGPASPELRAPRLLVPGEVEPEPGEPDPERRGGAGEPAGLGQSDAAG